MPFAISFLDVLCTILFIKADNAALLKIPQIVAMNGFLRKCIKHCINNVPSKKRQTLLHQCLSLFWICPNLHLGTFIQFVLYTLLVLVALKYPLVKEGY